MITDREEKADHRIAADVSPEPGALPPLFHNEQTGGSIMKTFSYEIKDAIGIHARPAGLLAKEAKKYESKIVIKKEGKSAEATKLMAIMGMGVKCGNVVDVEIEGADEEKAYEDIKAFFEANL